MKLLPSLICLLLGLTGLATAQPTGASSSAPLGETSTGLWLTVQFYQDIPFVLPDGKPPPNATGPDAEIGTLITTDARFQQQFTCPKGRYAIAGVVGAVSDGQYPLSIRLEGGSPNWAETRTRLSLDKPYGSGAIIIGGRVTGCYIMTLSHAPEWHEPNKPLDLTPHHAPLPHLQLPPVYPVKHP